MQPDDGREQDTLKLHEESENLGLVHPGKCCNAYLSRDHFLHSPYATRPPRRYRR